MHYFVLQLQNLQHLAIEDHDSVDNLNVSNTTIGFITQNFTSICKRYTKLMATKHQLQHYMFNIPNETFDANFTLAVIHLETAAFRLQHIQVSSLIHTIMQIICMIFKL